MPCHRIADRPVFVGYITAGYPDAGETPDLLLAMEKGGVDIIELGRSRARPALRTRCEIRSPARRSLLRSHRRRPDNSGIYSCDYFHWFRKMEESRSRAAIQRALLNGTDMSKCLDYVKEARAKGLKVPIIFFGYYNPFLIYGEDKILKACVEVGVNGFIIVDAPPEEASKFRDLCRGYGLSYVPLIAPSSSDTRISHLVSCADTFIYVVSALGVTGAREKVNEELPALIERVRKQTDLPLAVGFGVTTKEHFDTVGKVADGVVIGSQIIKVANSVPSGERTAALEKYCSMVCGRDEISKTGNGIAQLGKSLEGTTKKR